MAKQNKAKKKDSQIKGDIKNEVTLSYIILSVVFLFIIICRIRLLAVPLERDEGEYAYVGQQLLQGIPPFESIYHFKLPGVYVMNSLIIALFGNTQHAIHLGLLIVNLATVIFVYLIGKKVF